MNRIIATIFILMLVLSACYKDKEDLLYGNSNCDTSSVTYSNDIEPLIAGNCAISSCHVQGGLGVGLFENYDQTISKIQDGSFERRVIEQRNMPPSGPLTDCQIDQIEQWIMDGSPNN